MAKLEVTNKQLKLIQTALDFYSRVGIGQFEQIKDHPTFQEHLYKKCIPKKVLEVGDRTQQGEVLEIKGKKVLINGSIKNGVWDKKPKWVKFENVNLSTDYELYHQIRKNVDELFLMAKKELTQEEVYSNGGWGIFNSKVDISCVEAWDILQVIRHEFWKANPGRHKYTVDSSLHLTTSNSNKIKCEIDEEYKEIK